MEPSLPFRPFSLRFTNEVMEKSFLESRRPSLVRRVCRFMSAVLAAMVVLVTFLTVRQQPSAHAAARESLVVRLAVVGFLSLLGGLLLAVLCFREGRAVFRSHTSLEVAVVGLLALAMLGHLLSAPTRFVKLQGYDLEEVLGSAYDSDSTLLLVIDLFISVTHLGLPVRWHVMAPLEPLALACYALNVAVVGTEEPREHVFQNFVALAMLVALSALGKRSSERDERGAFSRAISEKALRCEAEYKLSQVECSSTTNQARSEGGSESKAPTERSNGTFEALYEKGGDKVEQLERVAARGEREHWRIPAEEVRVLKGEVLGSGGFGTVHRGVFCGFVVAVKRPHVEAARLPDIANELRVLRHLRHPHIVATHGAVVMPDEQEIYLVMELVDGVDLALFLKPKNAEQAPTVLARYQVMLGVCRALLYMHTRMPQIVHGDLKSSNIMVEHAATGTAVAKLLDFGLSRVVSRQARALGGTQAWVAPEVLQRGPVRCSADVFSLGHVLTFACTGVPPRRALCRRPREAAWPNGCEFLACRPLARECLQWQQELRPPISRVHELLLGAAPSLDLGAPPGLLQSVIFLKHCAEAGRNSFLRQLAFVAAPEVGGKELGSFTPSSRLTTLPEEEEAAAAKRTLACAQRESSSDSVPHGPRLSL